MILDLKVSSDGNTPFENLKDKLILVFGQKNKHKETLGFAVSNVTETLGKAEK